MTAALVLAAWSAVVVCGAWSVLVAARRQRARSARLRAAVNAYGWCRWVRLIEDAGPVDPVAPVAFVPPFVLGVGVFPRCSLGAGHDGAHVFDLGGVRPREAPPHASMSVGGARGSGFSEVGP